jgi:ArsR family metal-binding transcriptional regulator
MQEVSRDFIGEVANVHIYTAREAAEALDVSQQRFLILTKSKRLIPIKKDGRVSLYFRRDVESLKAELTAGKEKYYRPKGELK